ncbi:SigE family RNA polymerase sigma factor [Streptomyces nitrosporeus]|uniref:SigE family RNA polymerase sigma factor n=1 Tax=Streptomyces nitrosporeus TaxID=28894 RepID=A0A5J6FIN8_9ACTN|nr:SigE family RNA polymerase sigma factor [Streptomyces nitrosporeus]QEU74805.1 SigE family RNA polymerase sigma factor [Streptomyces nitrosporeus]GGY85910.1 RNA polymerase sigma24 factor [Streptomyces nitrosporeus]
MRQSEEDAFREFAKARMGHLFRSACLLTGGDTHLAEDLVQETLGKMYGVWGPASRVGNPAAYAQTVLVRCCLGYRRRRSSKERPSGELPDRAQVPVPDSSLRVTLLDALRGLPPKDRAVIVLRYWEDLSVAETADVLHTSPAAVRTRSTRALARLRERLGSSIGELTVH